MAKKGNVKAKALAMPAGIGIGLGAGLVITIVGAVLLAFALARETMSVETMGYGIMVVLFIATFLSSMVAMWCIKHRKMQVSLITAGAYLLSLLAMNALFFDGQYQGVGATVIVVAIAGVTAAFIGSGGGKTAKHKAKFRVNG